MSGVDQRRRRAAGALAVLLANPPRTDAAARALRVIVQEPGGPSDAVARVIEGGLERALRRPVLIEPRGGAGGRIAARLVAQSAPDGGTVGVGGPAGLVIASFLKRDIGYDPASQLAPLAALASINGCLAARPGLRVNRLLDLVDLARADPGRLTYASSAIGSTSHLTCAAIEAHFGVSMLHVPFRGSGPALQELSAGRIDLVVADIVLVKPLLDQGKAVAIAVTGPRGSALAPDARPLSEQGMPGQAFDSWFGLYAPAALGADAAAAIESAAGAAVTDPRVRELAHARGIELLDGSARSMRALVERDRSRYAPLVARIGLDRMP